MRIDTEQGDDALPVVRFDGVSMRYGRAPETLKDISFSLRQGSFHFLTGASGAGKSSLLRLLYLAHRPSRGLITMFGQDIVSLPREELPALRQQIGVVFQDFQLLTDRNVHDNLKFVLKATGWKDDKLMTDKINDVLDKVGLRTKGFKMPFELSGGEQQRVAVARALINQPDIIFADEPTGNVDPPMARRLLSLFLELNRLGTAVIIATHDVALMDQYEARRLVLHQGRLHIYE